MVKIPPPFALPLNPLLLPSYYTQTHFYRSTTQLFPNSYFMIGDMHKIYTILHNTPPWARTIILITWTHLLHEFSPLQVLSLLGLQRASCLHLLEQFPYRVFNRPFRFPSAGTSPTDKLVALALRDPLILHALPKPNLTRNQLFSVWHTQKPHHGKWAGARGGRRVYCPVLHTRQQFFTTKGHNQMNDNSRPDI